MANQPLQSPFTNQPHSLEEELTTKHLAYLVNTLHGVASKCHDFGLQLGVDEDTICKVEKDHKKCDDQLREILHIRLKLGYITINNIVQALKTEAVGEKLLASTIVHLFSNQLQGAASQQVVGTNTAAPPPPSHHSAPQPTPHPNTTIPCVQLYPPPRVEQPPLYVSCEQQALQGQPPLQHIPSHQPQTVAQSHDTGRDSFSSQPQPVANFLSIPPQEAHLPLHGLQPTPPLHQVTSQPVTTPTSAADQPSTAQHVQTDLHPNIPWQPWAGGGTPTPHTHSITQWPPDPPQLHSHYPLPYGPLSSNQHNWNTVQPLPISTHNPPRPQTHNQPLSPFTASSTGQFMSVYNTGSAASRPYPPPVFPYHFMQYVNQPSPNPQLSWGQGMVTPHLPQAGQQATQDQPQLQYVSSHESYEASLASSPQVHYESSMAQYIDYIKSVYEESGLNELSVVKWPPTPSKVYINLVCVDCTTHVSKEEVDEYTRAMVCDGNVDVVLGKKTHIDFSDIAKNVPTTKRNKRRAILVEGAAGMGKSTLAGEFCRRWERGEIAQQYQLVLLLRLRDKGMSEAQSLADLLYHPSKAVVQAVEDELIATLGANTLIILEGFDELPSTCRTQSSVFLRLINGTLLPHATVLVTSRPWATRDLRWKCRDRIFQHIEILGFTGKQIEEYVTSVFMDEEKVVNDKARKNIEEVMSYIKTYPQIKASMYIPLNSAIVVSVYQESKAGKCILPQTMTELYYALIQTLLLRYLYGHPEYGKKEWKIKSLKEDLPPDVYSKLLAISELAYSGICTDQESSVQLIFNNLPQGFETLGLMQAVPQLYVTQGVVMSYNFLHLTVQEFLAALHIFNMSPEKQLEHFQKQEEKGRWRVVLRFLAGITKLAHLSPDLLKGLLLKNSNEDLTKAANLSPSPLSLSQEKPDADQITKWEASMFVRKQVTGLEKVPKKWDRFNMTADVELLIQHVHWMFEAQRDDVVPLVLQERTVEFRGHEGLTPLDYYSLGYCIVHSHCQWVLTLGQDEIGEEEIRMLVAGTNTRCDTSAKVVGLRSYNSTVGFHEGGEYYPLTISAAALNVLFVETKNVLHLQELCLNLPIECSSIPWPGLSGVRVLHLEMKGGRNWRLDTLLRRLSLELLIITVSSDEGGLGSGNVASIEKLFFSSNCPKYVDITVAKMEREREFDRRTFLLKDKKPARCRLDWYSVGYVIAHSNFQWMLTVEQARCREEVIGEEEVRMLVAGFNTRQDTSAKVVGLTGRMDLHEGGGYCPLTISAEALNVLLVELKSVLQLQALHLTLPAECSSIPWPHLFKLHHPQSSSDCLKYLHFKRSVSLLSVLHITAEGMESIVKALSVNKSSPLRYLEVACNCTFSDIAAHHLALFITNGTTLHHLSIVWCTFSAHGLLELAQAIHHSSSLQKRKLEDLTCTVDGDDEATQLSVDYLQMMGCLSELTASHITDRGVQAIATALSHNSTLRRLNLSNNSISDTGLATLAQVLHHNSTLRELNLSNTSLSDTGSATLAEALRHNSTLKRLDLSGNDAITAAGTHHLVQALTVKKSIPAISDLDRMLIELRRMHSLVCPGDFLFLPRRCEEYATQCPQYSEVKDRIVFV